MCAENLPDVTDATDGNIRVAVPVITSVMDHSAHIRGRGNMIRITIKIAFNPRIGVSFSG